MLRQVRGLVLKSIQYGDYDKLVTILTEEGKFFFKARGVRSLTSKNAAGCAGFVYSEFILEQRGDKCFLRKAQPLYATVRTGCDITTLALASYLAEVAEDTALDPETGKSVLKLVMNALFLLSKEDRPTDLVKAIFELRLLAALGQMPLFDTCARCGKALEGEEKLYIRLADGDFLCSSCLVSRDENLRRLSRDVYHLARRSMASAEKEAYALRLPEKLLREFSDFAEKLFLFQMERSYSSLKFYHEVKKLPGASVPEEKTEEQT